MKNSKWSTAAAVLALGVLIGCSGRGSSSAAQDEALNALKNLRDRGVLTQGEYETKVATLLGSTDEATMRYFILIVALLLDQAAVLLPLAATHRGRS